MPDKALLEDPNTGRTSGPSRLGLSPAMRERLYARVHLASEPLAPFWPMRTFISRNPLSGLEHLPFAQAVEQGRALLGGRGYLPNQTYRTFYQNGRIPEASVARALARLGPRVGDQPLELDGRRIHPQDVFRLHLIYGIEPTTPEALGWHLREHHGLSAFHPHVPDDVKRMALGRGGRRSRREPGRPSESERLNGSGPASPLPAAPEWLQDTLEREETQTEASPESLHIQRLWASAVDACADWSPDGQSPHDSLRTSDGHPYRTAAEWVGLRTGVDVVGQINDQLIKWCAAFLDEGMASWAMPGREEGFYPTWRRLAVHDLSGWFLGIQGFARKVQGLPLSAEEALVSLLERLDVPEAAWEPYLCRHLTQLPGWAGFIRWRGDHPAYAWQQACPISRIDYLAVRLFYEVECVRATAQRHGDSASTLTALQRDPSSSDGSPDDNPATGHGDQAGVNQLCRGAWRVFVLAQLLGLSPADVNRRVAQTMVRWLEGFPAEAHGPVWLEAYEDGYQQELLGNLRGQARAVQPDAGPKPTFQAIFCIDVRSEPFRRHLEKEDGVETFGYAGFFGVPIRFRGLLCQDEAELCPVLVTPKHLMEEYPRSSQDPVFSRVVLGSRWREVGQHLLHHVKSHPIASYAVIDVVGLAYGVALIGKTLFQSAFRRFKDRVRAGLVPPVQTRVDVDKRSREELDVLIAAHQRTLVRDALETHPEARISRAASIPEAVDALRSIALEGAPPAEQAGVVDALRRAGLAMEDVSSLVDILRQSYHLTRHEEDNLRERLSRHGFSPPEQATFVENGLRLMGLTRRFGRLILACGHGSMTENNPYASALDCGACGGSHGDPNARVWATMANRPQIRAVLRERGIEVPDDTWFLAGKHNTTTDEVNFYDLQDVPATFHEDIDQLKAALARAGAQTARERCTRFPDAPRPCSEEPASAHVRNRASDWSQVRPEWGLSGNAAFIIGSRRLTRELDLEGRVFLHSYEPDQDPSGKALEVIMTAPLVVGEWINMQYYFSSVDPWAYGSGTKVLHNVVAGVGLMLGRQSDLQTGLPLQTVNNGALPYHEPVRLLVIIHAPRERIAAIIARHELLQHLVHNEWVRLCALDPSTGELYRHTGAGSWEPLPIDQAQPSHPSVAVLQA